MAFKDAMIENQIDKVVSMADKDALLPRLKAEPMPEFQKKLL